MKVLFLGFGITPYYRDFLNKLNSLDGLAIDNIRPRGENKSLGAGVHQDFSGIGFRDLELDEIRIPERRLLGLADFQIRPAYRSFSGLGQFLFENQPDVIVVNVVYHSIFLLDREVARTLKKMDVRVIFHSIPFGLETFPERLGKLPRPSRLKLEKFPVLGKAIRLTGLDLLYLKWVRGRAMERPIHAAQKLYQYPDAHAVYHEGGIEIYQSYGVPENKIFVVRNSPNTEKLIDACEKHGSVDHPPRLLHIGRLVAWKRVDLLIRAAAQLKESQFPDLDLVIIGYGPCEDELHHLALELGVQHSVHFLGGIYDADELARQAALSSIYVLAGMGGLSINEAMCFKLPIICSRGDGTEKHLVRDGINGLYFKEGDLENLKEKIAQILGDSKLRKTMAEQSRLIIEQEMNTGIHVNNYLELFENLTGQQLPRYSKPEDEIQYANH